MSALRRSDRETIAVPKPAANHRFIFEACRGIECPVNEMPGSADI
jgi:hypothetical protein